MPPQHSPESVVEELDLDLRALTFVKPPLPTLSSNRTRQASPIEVQLPPLIAGALVAAFAAAITQGLGSELLTHYYLSEQRVRINLDRVLDRLIAEFTRQLWDELFDFYQAANAQFGNQVSLLFDGPIRQIVLILTGPEVTRCILDKIGPGLSRRPVSWSKTSGGIELPLALQLVCTYWHREFAARSPGGNPDDIARSICTQLMDGAAARNLLAAIRHTLFSPHYVQIFIMESAIWDIVQQRRRPSPGDGFHALQFRFEVSLFDSEADITRLFDIGSLPVLTGTADNHISTTMSQYALRQWPKCGSYLLKCLKESIHNAAKAYEAGAPFEGMALLDNADEAEASGRGLRLLLIEIEQGVIRMSVSAWVLVLVDILQQMAWTCATLSMSPFPGKAAESALQVFDWNYDEQSTFVNCNLVHQEVMHSTGAPLLHQRRRATIATGFPIDDHESHQYI